MTAFRAKYDVDILVRGHGNLPLTRRLIRSIENNTQGVTYQITYVDNGSTLYDLTQLMQDYPRVQYVRLPFNHGSVRAINVGLTFALASSSRYVLLLDNDTEVPMGDSGWLARWCAYIDENEQIGAAGAVTNYVSGWQHIEAAPDYYTRAWEDKETGQQGLAETLQVPVLVSFGMLMRKAAVQATGMFDERFEPGNCEDYDYTLRMREHGYLCVIANSVWLHHKGSQTFRQFDFNALLRDNYRKLVDKWTIARLAEMGVNMGGEQAVTA